MYLASGCMLGAALAFHLSLLSSSPAGNGILAGSLYQIWHLLCHVQFKETIATISNVCRTKHRLHLVSRRFNEALREPCDVWQHLTLHAKQISKVAYLLKITIDCASSLIPPQCEQDTWYALTKQTDVDAAVPPLIRELQQLTATRCYLFTISSLSASFLQCQPWFVNWLRPRATAVQMLDATFSTDDTHRLELLLSLLGR